MAPETDFELLKALVKSDAQLALARQEVDALNDTLWVVRAEGYRKADLSFPTLAETGVVKWSEARSWGRGRMIELTAQVIYELMPTDLNVLAEANYVNFRGIAWKMVQVFRRQEIFGSRVEGGLMLEISLVATASPDSKGPPQPAAPVKDRAWFESLMSGGAVPVMLENGQMGAANHWHDDGVLIDAYQGNEHMGVYRVPYANLIHMGGGGFTASLKGVPAPTDAEGKR